MIIKIKEKSIVFAIKRLLFLNFSDIMLLTLQKRGNICKLFILFQKCKQFVSARFKIKQYY